MIYIFLYIICHWTLTPEVECGPKIDIWGQISILAPTANNQDWHLAILRMQKRTYCNKICDKKNQITHVCLIQSRHLHHNVRCNLFQQWYYCKIACFGVKQQSLTPYDVVVLLCIFKPLIRPEPLSLLQVLCMIRVATVSSEYNPDILILFFSNFLYCFS